MTKQQKNEARLQKEIRRLERDKFVLENQIKDLIRETKDLKREIFTLKEVNEKLDASLIESNKNLQTEKDRVKNIISEVNRYTSQDAWTYLKGK